MEHFHPHQSASKLWTLHASRQCLHRAVGRQIGRTLPRSGRRLARGERFLRTPGIRAYLTTRPGRGGGTPTVLQPRWGGFLGWAHHQGFAKNAHPWLISSHPSGVEEHLELRAGLRPKGAVAHVWSTRCV